MEKRITSKDVLLAMVLIYLDESGDTGVNLSDVQQPVFVLGAMLMPQDKWKPCEEKFRTIISDFFGGKVPENFELHTMDMVSRSKWFKNYSIDNVKSLRDRLIQLVIDEKIPIMYRKIIKKDYQRYCENKYGKSIKIEPYIMAFPFICFGVESYLKENKDLAILILDEHRSFKDIEQSLKILRNAEIGKIGTESIIEKGFSVDSSKSYPIQLLDLFLYYLRKYHEHKLGKKVSLLHQEVFSRVVEASENLDNHNMGSDILEWVDNRISK